MWLIGVVLTYLVLVKPSTADLGLPVSIPGLRTKVHSLIETIHNLRKPYNKTLQELDALPVVTSLGSDFQRVRVRWLDAMANLSRIQNVSLTNLTNAIDDKTSGHRKILDGLYNSFRSLQQQVTVNRDMIGEVLESRGGSGNVRSLNVTRTLLEIGLDRLLNALKTLDEAISKAQRVKPLTESSILKAVDSGLSWNVWTAVVKIIDSTISLDTLANKTLKATRLAAQDANDTRDKLKKMIDGQDAETVLAVTVDAVANLENISVALIQKLNQTVCTSYEPLIKDSSNQGAKEIDAFLQSFVEAMTTLSNSIPNLSQRFLGYAADTVPWFQQSVEQRIESGLSSAAEKIFASGNISLSENCTRKHPLINGTLGKTFTLMKSCTWKQREDFPKVIEAIEEYLEPFSTAALALLEDLRTCNASKLDRNLCLGTFVTTYMSESNAAAINRLLAQTHRKMENEFAAVSIRLQSCTSPNVALDTLDELLRKREACYDGKEV